MFTYFYTKKASSACVGQYYYHDLAYDETIEFKGHKLDLCFQNGHSHYGNDYSAPSNHFDIFTEYCDNLVDSCLNYLDINNDDNPTHEQFLIDVDDMCSWANELKTELDNKNLEYSDALELWNLVHKHLDDCNSKVTDFEDYLEENNQALIEFHENEDYPDQLVLDNLPDYMKNSDHL